MCEKDFEQPLDGKRVFMRKSTENKNSESITKEQLQIPQCPKNPFGIMQLQHWHELHKFLLVYFVQLTARGASGGLKSKNMHGM